ncbi:hypothetical protein D770_25070 [Flammeovirgaceae bacterium 311]|nr:hypothetical protein D770_25070 [Flammeovirgaceae bacterium 311]
MPFATEKYGSQLLLGLFIIICAALVIRIKVEATHYTSPDSHFYMRVADNLLEGKGLVAPMHLNFPFREKEKEYYFAVWPAGYPLLIAGVSKVTQTSTLVASKIVNIIFLGLMFLLLYSWFGRLAWFPALYFCSFNLLEVYSYTWSEGPFLFFVMYLCFLLHKDQKQEEDSLLFLKLFLCLFSLFMLRYAGIIFYSFAGLYFLKHLYYREHKKSWHYFTALVFASGLAFGYLWLNKKNSGFFTGMDRIRPEAESFSYFTELLLQGLFNEFAVIRNYYFRDYTDFLFLTLFIVQLGLLYYVIRQTKQQGGSAVATKAVWKNLLLQAGVYYLLAVTILRKIDPFDEFNYRILAPFSVPIFIYLLSTLSSESSKPVFRQVWPWLSGFFLLSLLMNLPKQFLIELFTGAKLPL